jgi:hypothetical protein
MFSIGQNERRGCKHTQSALAFFSGGLFFVSVITDFCGESGFKANKGLWPEF